jgi:hypothetical protein
LLPLKFWRSKDVLVILKTSRSFTNYFLLIFSLNIYHCIPGLTPKVKTIILYHKTVCNMQEKISKTCIKNVS